MSRIRWWPVGHHLLPKNSTLTLEDQMTWQEALDLAEIEADIAQEQLDQALDDETHPAFLEALSTQATLARHRYYDALNADLAQ